MFDLDSSAASPAPVRQPRQPSGPNHVAEWMSRFTATTAGVFVGGALLLVALYFLVSYQVNKAITNIEKNMERMEQRRK